MHASRDKWKCLLGSVTHTLYGRRRAGGARVNIALSRRRHRADDARATNRVVQCGRGPYLATLVGVAVAVAGVCFPPVAVVSYVTARRRCTFRSAWRLTAEVGPTAAATAAAKRYRRRRRRRRGVITENRGGDRSLGYIRLPR